MLGIGASEVSGQLDRVEVVRLLSSAVGAVDAESVTTQHLELVSRVLREVLVSGFLRRGELDAAVVVQRPHRTKVGSRGNAKHLEVLDRVLVVNFGPRTRAIDCSSLGGRRTNKQSAKSDQRRGELHTRIERVGG